MTQVSKTEIAEIASAIAVAVSQQEKDSMVRNNWKFFGTVAGVLLAASALHATYLMPAIREDTRMIVNERVERIEIEKVDVDVFRTVLDRLERMERKIDDLKR